MSDNEKISRAEFHRRIWTTSLKQMGLELGCTYLDLLRICKDYNIPRPTGGYWYRLEHGGNSEQVPLPPVAIGVSAEIELGRKDPPATLGKHQIAADSLSGAGNILQSETCHSGQAALEGSQIDKVESNSDSIGNKNATDVTLQPAVPQVPVRITRTELYAKVWKSNFRKLSLEFGTTYVELARVCEELKVPRPGPNYWPRLRLGLPVEVLPLPEAEPGAPLECVIQPEGRSRKRRKDRVPELSEPSVDTSVSLAGDADTSGSKSVAELAASGSGKVGQTVPTAASELPAKVEYTRQQLYKAIWAEPCMKLAASLGISDVALAKTCRRLGIPRPPRGYWARIEAGEKLGKDTLPAPKPGQDQIIKFDVVQNMVRRQEWAAHNVLTSSKGSKPGNVELAPEGNELHPIAEKHRQALEKAKPDELGMVTINRKDLFPCNVSLVLMPRLARALDAILCELEDRDYSFVSGQNEWEGLKIAREGDEASLRWSEALVETEREPTNEDKRKPSWTWQLKETKASGQLSVEVTGRDLRGRRRWSEGAGRSLPEILGVVVEKLEAVFRGFEDRRKREAERTRQREEADRREAEQQAKEAEHRAELEKQRKERERIRRHEAKLQEIADAWRNNLAAAAGQWIEAQQILDFIKTCEEKWRLAGDGALSKPQTEWLEWARIEAGKMVPLANGYPDPAKDGRLDVNSVSPGGPYPETKDLGKAPPAAPAPAVPEVKTVYVEQPRPPEQFPYWHLHRKH